MSDTSTNAAKKLARLMAVQSLYQASFGEDKPADIIRSCIDDTNSTLNAEDAEGPSISGMPDPELLSDIVQGVLKHQPALEEMLTGAIDAKSSAHRMEKLLRTILLAGAYELHHHAQVDTGIIINDYVDVTRAFFNAKEPGLINAILDKLAKALRG